MLSPILLYIQIDFVVQNDAPYPMGDNPDIYKPIKDAG